MQRIRVTFARGERTKFIGHLDLIRFWERAIRRAALPVAYSEGFNPRPRLAMAAPLPVGFTSEVELIDLVFEGPTSPREVLVQLGRETPPGIDVLAAELVDPAAPSLQSLMAGCIYHVRLAAAGKTRAEVEEAVRQLMETAHLPWEWDRDGETKRLDLRVLIEEVWLHEWRDDEAVLGMRLVHDSNAAGRPEHVAQALGFAGFPLAIHRTGLVLREQRSTPAQLAARLAQSARDRERARTGAGAHPAQRSPAPRPPAAEPQPGGTGC